MQVGSLGQEDPLEKEMAAHSSIPGWAMVHSITKSRTLLKRLSTQACH